MCFGPESGHILRRDPGRALRSLQSLEKMDALTVHAEERDCGMLPENRASAQTLGHWASLGV